MTQEAPAHPAKHHRYITTFSGQKIDSLNLRPQQVVRADVTRALAMQTRYLGHIKDFYSIAEHSVLVSRILEKRGHPTFTVQAGLLHDGHEAFTGDFPSPFKYDVLGLREWEGSIERTFRESQGLHLCDGQVWEPVKEADLDALHFEASELMECRPDWIDTQRVALIPKGLAIRCYSWRHAMSIFSARARDLGLPGF